MTLYCHSYQNSNFDNCIDDTLAKTSLRRFYEARAGDCVENCQGRQTTSSPRSRLSNMNSDFRLHFTKIVGGRRTPLRSCSTRALETAYMDPSYLNLDRKN